MSALVNNIQHHHSSTTTTSTTAADTTPGSPPELTGSKSSKSSGSFRSSCLADQQGQDNLSHFEDIALADSGRDDSDDLHIHHHRQPLKQPSVRPSPRRVVGSKVHHNGPPKEPVLRDTTNMSRPRYPSLQNQVNAASFKENADIHPVRRGFTSPSVPSLAMGSRQRPSRSSSPHSQTNSDGGGRSPRSAVPRFGSNLLPKPRKTVQELEAEYHDSDEDVPEDAVIWNVPISSRPPMSFSTPPSPTRIVSSTMTLDLPPIPITKTGSEHTSRSSELPRPTGRPSLQHSATVAAFPTEATSSRGKCWTDDLSQEAREVAAALEEHAESLSEERRRSARNSSCYSPPRPAMKLRTKTSFIEMPPMQKGNVMIDPLPISKEKEAVLTRTRPSWLPPKSQKEERKHLKEFERMMAAAEQAEKKRLVKEAEQQEEKARRETEIARTWEEHVLPNWDSVINEPSTRNLWWRGVQPKQRGTVWAKAIGNELSLTEASYTNALKRARALQSTVNELPEEERTKHQDADWLAAISRDVPCVYPELGIFGQGAPLHDTLEDVLLAYSAYRSDVGYVYGVHLMAGLLVLNMSASAAFIALANLLNRPLALAFLVEDTTNMSRIYGTVLSTLEYKLPRLHEHLLAPTTGFETGPEEWLHPFLTTLGTHILSADAASRLWDVAVFEGDKTFVRAAVGVLSLLENKLYGSREEILKLVGWNASKLAFEDEQIIIAVREAGKVSLTTTPPPDVTC